MSYEELCVQQSSAGGAGDVIAGHGKDRQRWSLPGGELIGTPLKLSAGGAIPQISKAWEKSLEDMPSRGEWVATSTSVWEALMG